MCVSVYHCVLRCVWCVWKGKFEKCPIHIFSSLSIPPLHFSPLLRAVWNWLYNIYIYIHLLLPIYIYIYIYIQVCGNPLRGNLDWQAAKFHWLSLYPGSTGKILVLPALSLPSLYLSLSSVGRNFLLYLTWHLFDIIAFIWWFSIPHAS